MFSRRLDWEAHPNRLSEALAARRARGERVLDLTNSNPARAGLTFDAGPLEVGAGYDPSPRGSMTAREAVARYLGEPADAGSIVLTASTSEAYAALFKLLCDPGDEVLAPRPSYPLFEYLARLECVEVRQYSLSYHEGWWIEPGEIERRLTDRTRAVIAVSPNNPTGSCLKQEEAAALDELCARRGIAVISDEVFADYCFDGPPRSMIHARGALTFVLGGLSKSLGLPQVKLGWIAAAGPPDQRERALARLDLIADTFLSVSAPAQSAAVWLARRAPFQAAVMERLRANLAVLRRHAEPLHVEGGWSAVIRLPATRPEEDQVVGFLERQGVLAQPGYFYDFETGPYAVVSLLTPPDVLGEGLERITHDAAHDG